MTVEVDASPVCGIKTFFLVLPYIANIYACYLFIACLTLIPGPSSPSPCSSRLKTGISTKWKKNQTSVVRVQSLGSSFRNLFCSFSRSGSKNLSNSSFFIVSAKCRLGKGSNLFQVKVNQGPPPLKKIVLRAVSLIFWENPPSGATSLCSGCCRLLPKPRLIRSSMWGTTNGIFFSPKT